MLLKPCVSPPSPWFHSLSATAGVRKKKKKKKGRAMWRQANLKAIIDHQPPWLVWLQCARCNWLGTAIRSFNRKYTLSLSISFKKWQHWEKTELSKATVLEKHWIHCRCHSNADPYNQTQRYPAKLHLQSGWKCTAILFCFLSFPFFFSPSAPCCFLWICWDMESKETQCSLLDKVRVLQQ